MLAPAATDARAPAPAVTPPHAALPRLQTLPQALPACVLALGAHLKNTACLGVGRQVLWSGVHGDLADVASCTALQASVARLLALAREQGVTIRAVAHDLHPDFFSTRLAQQTAERLDVPAIPVQHHHAHVAVLLAEAGRTRPTTGLALDGYGMGSDGGAWGGELLRVGTSGWQRLGRLSPLALPGGDRAALEPWRMAAAALQALGRGGEIVPRWSASVDESAARTIAAMLARNVRCPRRRAPAAGSMLPPLPWACACVSATRPRPPSPCSSARRPGWIASRLTAGPTWTPSPGTAWGRMAN